MPYLGLAEGVLGLAELEREATLRVDSRELCELFFDEDFEGELVSLPSMGVAASTTNIPSLVRNDLSLSVLTSRGRAIFRWYSSRSPSALVRDAFTMILCESVETRTESGSYPRTLNRSLNFRVVSV